MAFFLFLGVFFLPTNAEAGIFSMFLGDQADASTGSPNSPLINNSNSQNMALLEAGASPLLAMSDKKAAGVVDEEDISINSSIVSENALLPTVGPLGVSDETDIGGSSSGQVSVYVVRKGDSISQIADMFDVSIDTILTANDMRRGDKLSPGQVLIILPVSGLEHTVTKGQTLQSIAKLYKVAISDITSYNGIAPDAKLAVGDKLIIPGADMADEGGDKPASNLSSAVAKDKNYYATHPIRDAAGYFINPLPTGRKTQGLHGPGNRGIDIGAPTGTPIYASASGTVLIAKTGWNGGYGNMVIIQHANGTKTLYAHMSKLGTFSGAQVSQGQIIGYVGSTGHSTGPHLHFEVFNAKNPGADWSWKQ